MPETSSSKAITSRSDFSLGFPIISCVMPVYNCENYLLESIQSILTQTFPNFEFIIINDGSTDSSLSIIRGMQAVDDRIIVINQENKGITAALNAGLKAARGAFIARMDADDISLPDRFKVQYDFLLEHPDVVLVGGLAGSVDAQGNRSNAAETGNRHELTDLLYFPPKVVTVLHPLMMARTEAIKAIGGYSSRYYCAEDYDLFMRISELGRIAHVDERIFDYRTHGENISLKNLETQERNAALAELDNVKSARSRSGKKLSISEATLAAYVAIRILRRERSLGTRRGAKPYLGIAVNILKGAPWSEVYTTARLVFMLVFQALTSARSAFRCLYSNLIFLQTPRPSRGSQVRS